MRGSCIVVELVVIRVIRVIRFSIIYIVYNGTCFTCFLNLVFPCIWPVIVLSFWDEANLIG